MKILKSPIFWIFILALFLRIYKLGEFPYGFHVDEVKVGWNAVSILKTGKDDHLNFLSLYYNSFGDYRPTGIFYFTIPSILVFGRTEFATRFPVALLGSLTVIPIYYLSNTIAKKRKLTKKGLNTGNIAAFLLAISPWHIELSRATNEVVISTLFALFAIYFFIRLIEDRKIIFSYLSVSFMAVSYLSYHAIRFLGPFIFIITFIYYFRSFKTGHIKKYMVLCIFSIFAFTTLLSFTKEGLARFDQVSIFKDVDVAYQIQRIGSENQGKKPLALLFDNKLVIYSQRFVQEYSRYFSADFLIGATAKPYRFSTPGTGLLTYIEFVLFLIGLVKTLKGEYNYLPLILLMFAPLPAAITAEDAPNLSRAFLMLPFIILIEAKGLTTLIEVKKKFKRQISISIMSLLLLNFTYFSYMYLHHAINHRPYLKDYSGDSPTYRDVGAKELVLKLDSLNTKYEKVIITNFPDNLYPWYAYFTNKNPQAFNTTYSTKTNERDYENIVFSQDKCPSDTALAIYLKKKVLIVDSWECSFKDNIFNNYPLKIVGSIKRPDGSEVYTFLERDWSKPLVINGVIY